MKTTIIFICFLSFNLIFLSQNIVKPNSLITSVGYQSNLKNHSFTFELSYRFKFIVNNRINLLTIGTGINVLKNHENLYNIKINVALNQGYTIYFIGGTERYSKWFIGGQYNFSDSFNKQFISPELGYNIRILSRLHFAPKLIYNISISQNQTKWSESFFLNFSIRFLFSNLIRPQNKDDIRATF